MYASGFFVINPITINTMVNIALTPGKRGQWGPIIICGFPFSSAKKEWVLPNFE